MRNELKDCGPYHLILVTTRTGTLEVKIDTEDVEQVTAVDRWCMFKDRKGTPLMRSGMDSGQVFLHRLLMPKLPNRATVGFKNGDHLDYRRDNLQIIRPDGTIVDFISEAEIAAREAAAAKDEAAATNPQHEVLQESTLTTFEEILSHIPEVDAPPVETHPAPPESPPPEKSKVRGVYKHKASKKWHAAAFWEGKRYSLGYFDEQLDAENEVGLFRKHGPHYPTLRRNTGKKHGSS